MPIPGSDRRALGLCGTRSGFDTDKIEAAGLTLVDGEEVDVPAIEEFPLTLECRVVYKQTQVPDSMPRQVLDDMYPQNVGSENSGANRDFHTAYYGEIVKAYIIE